MSSNKKNLIIIFIVVVLVAIAVGVAYYFFFMKGETGEPAATPSFPIGPIGGLPSTPTGGTGTPTTGTGTKVNIPRLRQITKEPVGGAGIFGDVIRYIQRADGNIFETKTDILTVNRISNKTIPKIYEAIWAQTSGGQGGAGDIVITRQLKDDSETIESFAAKISGSASSTEKTLGGVYLPQKISALVISPDKSQMFYLYPTGSGAATMGVAGIFAKADGSKKTLIFESPLSEWLADFADNKTVVLTTKPSAGAAGFSYLLNTSNGEIKKILGNIAGLTILISPDKKLILYSESINNSFKTKLYNLTDNRSTDFVLQTLPEKCVWGKEGENIYCAAPKAVPTGNYPDSWYQGRVSFSDDIWKINTATGETNRLISPEAFVNKTIDVINPLLNENESFLLFMNKIDLSLWVLDIR